MDQWNSLDFQNKDTIFNICACSLGGWKRKRECDAHTQTWSWLTAACSFYPFFMSRMCCAERGIEKIERSWVTDIPNAFCVVALEIRTQNARFSELKC